MNLLNFAHGQMFMIGGFMVYYVYGVWGLPFALGLLVAAVVVGAIGVLFEVLFFRRVRQGGDARGEQHAARRRHRAAAREPGAVRVRREAARRAARRQPASTAIGNAFLPAGRLLVVAISCR